MAASSSDESSSTAPKDFQFSSSLDSGSRLSPNRQRCPLCAAFHNRFHCRECLRKGIFYPSTGSRLDSFAERQLILLQLRENKRHIEDECTQHMEQHRRADHLRNKIRLYKDRIRICKLALDEKKTKQLSNKTSLDKLSNKNQGVTNSLPKYRVRVEKLEHYVLKKQEDHAKIRADMEELEVKLRRHTRAQIQQLLRYIFPITKIQPTRSITSSTDMDSSGSDLATAIAEAAHTTYIRDRWVYTDNSGELQYSIVAPTLPGSGNYSAYNVWVAQNRGDSVTSGSTSTLIEQNAAYSISAALTYTAQLVNMIAYYLDTRLPYKLVYSDFCSSYTEEQQFSRRVARLNANVLHLCFSQNVNLASLQPTQTLHNILHLVESQESQLGRKGPLEVDAQMAGSLEDQLGRDLKTGKDSDSEEGDAFPYEWEAVPHVQCPEATAGPMTLQSTQTISVQQTQAHSIAGGLYNSAAASLASLWHNVTGR